MLKRAISLLPLIIATVILLAHEIVPHHYHQQAVCIETQHCEHDAQAHDHDADDHHHDEQNSTRSCVLKQAAVLPAGQFKQHCGCGSGHFHAHAAILSAIQALPEVQIQLLACEHFLKTNIQLHQQHFLPPTGLRAPPLS